MKLTSKKLKQIIKEEMKKLQEMGWHEDKGHLPPPVHKSPPFPDAGDYEEMAYDAMSPEELENLSDKEIEMRIQQLADEMSRRGNPSQEM